MARRSLQTRPPLRVSTRHRRPSSRAREFQSEKTQRENRQFRLPKDIYSMLNDFYHTVTSFPDTAQRNALLREIQAHPGCEDYTPHQLRVYFKTKRKEERRAAHATSEAERLTTTQPVKQRFKRVPTSHQHNVAKEQGKTCIHSTKRRVSDIPAFVLEEPTVLLSGGFDESLSTTDYAASSERLTPRSPSSSSHSLDDDRPHLAEPPSTDPGVSSISDVPPTSGDSEVCESVSIGSVECLNAEISQCLSGSTTLRAVSDGTPGHPVSVSKHAGLAAMLHNALGEPSRHASERPKTFQELSRWIEEERRRALLPLLVSPMIWHPTSGP
ncbi:hypothetical protein C8Q80DRAFT_206341 [Daedaleopsis nitida]|nr:hypothetical protein C8Q80DRAFT_206341 [Daedaleopsis nitida]